MNKQIGFIGCGKMASAIISAILVSKSVSQSNILASVTTLSNSESKSKQLGIKVITDNKKVAQESDVIFISTTPNIAETVLEEIKEKITEDKLIVSICAGITTEFIEKIIGGEKHVIRVMPNTPSLILEGMSGISSGKSATVDDIETVEELLSKIGKTIVVDESQMDIVTAISGSGPAFYYKVINDIARAGEKLGLDYQKALDLSIQTAIGSAKMLLASDKTAEELISSVATKGGCTRVGVDYMEDVDTSEIFCNLIRKTAQKARDLGK